MPTFEDYEVVKLKRNIPTEHLSIGAIGTVVMVHRVPSIAYEVEFDYIPGSSMPVLTLTEDDLEPITDEELEKLRRENEQYK